MDVGRLHQRQVVTLAAYVLGGDSHVLDTEDIAIKAADLAPGRFSWRKYKHQINLELVRVYLSDAKKNANGAMIAGSGRMGWTLTAAGRAWARGIGRGALKVDPRQRTRSAHTTSPSETRRQRERTRIQGTQAWSRWTRRQQISSREAAEVFRIDVYAQGRIRDLKVGRVRDMFEDDPEIGPFVVDLAVMIESRGEKGKP